MPLTEKPPPQRASQSSLPEDPFQPSRVKIPVKSIAGRVVKRDTTPVIAPATPGEKLSLPKINHFDRS